MIYFFPISDISLFITVEGGKNQKSGRQATKNPPDPPDPQNPKSPYSGGEADQNIPTLSHTELPQHTPFLHLQIHPVRSGVPVGER